MMSSITELLNIKYPIIQGGLQYISRSPLVSAVSNAGGLGVLTTGGMDKEELREQIQEVKKQTDKPFAVNLTLIQKNIEELVDVVVEENVPIVTTGAGSPKKFIPKLKENNTIILPVIAAVKHAKKMEALNVDGLIVEGQEAGGHIGQLSTLPLVRQIVKATHLPVIAAGGIGDGHGLVAALALGASGVQMGTVFLATHECPIPDSFKQAIIEADDLSTIVTGRTLGHPVRAIRNEMLQEYLELEQNNASQEELDNLVKGSLYKAIKEGDRQRGTMQAGEISGLITEIKSVAEVITSITSEAKDVLKQLELPY